MQVAGKQHFIFGYNLELDDRSPLHWTESDQKILMGAQEKIKL